MLDLAAMRTEGASPRVDAAIAALANRQHGVIARGQLRDLGVSGGAVAHRVATGRLHRVHRGEYAVGHSVLGAHGHWMAAVLSCGPGAVLSHGSAAALWGLRASAATKIDITVPGSGGRRQRSGVRIHRARSVGPGEATTHHRIPLTTPARTILDLAATLAPRRLERLLDQAEILELADARSLDAFARAHPGHRGTGKLRVALSTHNAGSTLTRSELEERFLALCRAHALPEPDVNTHVGGVEVDFVFRRQKLVVETDGWRYHRTRQAFERDRRRDAALTRAGYRTLRFTHDQLANEPHAVARTVSAALLFGG